MSINETFNNLTLEQMKALIAFYSKNMQTIDYKHYHDIGYNTYKLYIYIVDYTKKEIVLDFHTPNFKTLDAIRTELTKQMNNLFKLIKEHGIFSVEIKINTEWAGEHCSSLLIKKVKEENHLSFVHLLFCAKEDTEAKKWESFKRMIKMTKVGEELPIPWYKKIVKWPKQESSKQ